MSVQVMIDLETFGTGNDAVILSIGAVKFDPETSGMPLTDGFYVAIDPRSCVAAGLKMDASTVMWWMDEDRDEARRALMSTERLDLVTALEGFTMWFGHESLPVWGNGATFDNVILRSAFRATGQDCPWHFWHDRCYRTVKNLAPGVELQREGTHHHALADARSQAAHLLEIMTYLGVGG